jgi:quinolinate synthase
MIKNDQWIAMLLPPEIRTLTQDELIEKIRGLKSQYGDTAVILAHHYQRSEVVMMADFRGDSLELVRRAHGLESAKYIIFCGVQFMVEMAAILCRPEQKVVSPAPNAICPLAHMASIEDVTRAWNTLSSIVNIKRLIPVVYVNSLSEVKAFCGEHGGIICTSSNTRDVVKWAMKTGERFFFLPDENLGVNTCNALGIPKDKIVTWDPALPDGGCDPEDIKGSMAILWKGFCHVHTDFTLQQVKMARENYPGCLVVVHPECNDEVVGAADATGSTSFIVQYVEEASPGSTIVIGTEFNLVRRLTEEHPDRTIIALSDSSCPDMSFVNLRNLFWVLSNLGKVNIVEVDEKVKKNARLALERMLSLS